MKRKMVFWIIFTIAESIYVSVEFEWDGNGDSMIPARNALFDYMDKNYKGKEYDVGYSQFVD